jgi:hypothetical protein
MVTETVTETGQLQSILIKLAEMKYLEVNCVDSAVHLHPYPFVVEDRRE